MPSPRYLCIAKFKMSNFLTFSLSASNGPPKYCDDPLYFASTKTCKKAMHNNAVKLEKIICICVLVWVYTSTSPKIWNMVLLSYVYKK
jgi:hypothetical protein